MSTLPVPRGATGDQLPFTVLLPEDPTSPTLLYDTTSALAFALVDRASLTGLDDEWEEAGVYLLLDRHGADGSWGCYVGKGPSGIRSRVKQHVVAKDHWTRALLIRRDTTYGFTSAHAGWLESKLYDVLAAAASTLLHNGNRPSDDTLPPYERAALEATVEPVRRVLRLLGFDTDPPDDQPASPTAPAAKKSMYAVTMAELINAGLLSPGEVLTSTNSVWPATAIIESDGSVRLGPTSYKNPSGAASAVKQGGAANGWDFWAVERSTGSTRLATLRAHWLASNSTSGASSALT